MDVAAAFCVGWSETLVGFPFLTAKVLVQNGHKWWGHPFRRYYQGVKYPLMSSVGFNMVVFPLHDRLYPYTGSYALSGLLSGLVVSPQMYGSALQCSGCFASGSFVAGFWYSCDKICCGE